MTYSVVVLLAGKSNRFKTKSNTINKVFEVVKGKMLIEYSLDVFLQDSDCEKIILVYRNEDEETLQKLMDKSNKLIKTLGGEERYISVKNGLKLVETKYVLIHDGARPNITIDLVKKVTKELEKNACVSLALKVTDTVKEVNSNKVQTLDRENLYLMQTPQGMETELLKKCLAKVTKEDKITDDLMAIEKYSEVVPSFVLGSKKNIKITVSEDIDLFKYYLGD